MFDFELTEGTWSISALTPARRTGPNPDVFNYVPA